MSGMEQEQILSDQVAQQAPAPEQAAPQAPQEQPQAIPPKPAPTGAPTPPENVVYVTGERRPMINAADMKMEDAAFHDDLMRGHIKPETYHSLFAKKDTLGKIGTIFGLMVGGAGAGLSHQPNALLEMMNREIQNDLEAQKASVGGKQNFVRLSMEQQMNIAQIKKLKQEGKLTESQAAKMEKETELAGYTLANMRANRAVLHDLVAMTNKLPQGSEQRQKAEQTLAFLSNAVQSENYSLADRAHTASALANVAFGEPDKSGGSEQSFQQKQQALRIAGMGEMANVNEQRHLPVEGLKGQASIPLSSADRDQLQSGAQFQDQLDRFIQWTKEHSGDLDPREHKKGVALAAEVQAGYRKATNGGVYKEGEQNFISKIIDSTPTKFFNEFRVTPGLETVSDENRRKVDAIAKSKGFKGYEPTKKEEKKKTVSLKEGDTGTYQGKPVIVRNGKWEYK